MKRTGGERVVKRSYVEDTTRCRANKFQTRGGSSRGSEESERKGGYTKMKGCATQGVERA